MRPKIEYRVSVPGYRVRRVLNCADLDSVVREFSSKGVALANVAIAVISQDERAKPYASTTTREAKAERRVSR